MCSVVAPMKNVELLAKMFNDMLLRHEKRTI